MPICGVKLAMVGAGAAAPTTKLVALCTLPALLLTVILPVVAPVGTVTVKLVAVAALTVAVVVLNFTVLLAGVVLKPDPYSVTVVPAGPTLGVNSVRLTVLAPLLRMAVMLPARS